MGRESASFCKMFQVPFSQKNNISYHVQRFNGAISCGGMDIRGSVFLYNFLQKTSV